MRIPCRQHWLLRRMERRLCRSDPHLAAMLAMFTRLTVGEATTSTEQAHPENRVQRGLAWLWAAITGLGVGLADGVSRVLRRIATTCAVVRGRLSGGARAVPSASSTAYPRTHRDGPGLPTS